MINKEIQLPSATLYLSGQNAFRCSVTLVESTKSSHLLSRFLLVGTLTGNEKDFGSPVSVLCQIRVQSTADGDSVSEILKQFIDWILVEFADCFGLVECEKGCEYLDIHWVAFSLTRI